MAWKIEKWQALFNSWLASNAKRNAPIEAKIREAATKRDRDALRKELRPDTAGGAAVAMGRSVGTTWNWKEGTACPHWNDVNKLATQMGLPAERIRRAINATKGPQPKFAAQAKARAALAEKKRQPVPAGA